MRTSFDATWQTSRAFACEYIVPAKSLSCAPSNPFHIVLPEPYLSTDRVLNLLGISRPTLYRWMQQGLPVHGQHTGRHLRFRASEIEAWMRGNTSPMESQLSEITG